MNPDRWTRVAQLYEAALERLPSERGSFLAQACGGDADMQREIESLLAQDEHSGLLDRPVLEGAADLLGDREGLAAGARLGPYRLDGMIGSGGMGEVYRATDTRLDRTVAVKILPSDLSADRQFRERFDREARAVAALSHPHICALYDVGRDEGVDFLVLEYLEGETLATRLEKGALPLDQALRHAADIADALAIAHRSGIVHRDLKPANIFLTKAGAKLLDFGLAKTTAPAVVGTRASAAATAPERLTAQGTILGTFQYMAPEQLEGGAVDTRTDIFAFGAVLYEMVTGHKAFQGKSQASLIGAILKDDPPPIDKSQPLTPPSLDRIVRRCLAKNPDDRWQSAADLAHELRWTREGRDRDSAALTIGTAIRSPRVWRMPVASAAAGLVLGVALTGIAWIIVGPRAAPAPRPARFEIIPSTAPPLSSALVRTIAISPDGSHLVYRSGTGSQAQLVVRPMNELAGRVLSVTGGNQPFFSPDGHWIGFNGSGRLQKIPITGGAAIPIGPVGAPERGATWTSDGRIIFASADQSTGLVSVSADGGEPTVLTVPDASKGELDHWFPAMLPDSRGVLFTIVAADRDNNQVAVLDLKTGRRKPLIKGGSQAEYIESGHLLYVAAGTLHAVRFDPVRLEVLSGPVAVADKVLTTGLGVAQFSVSRGGTFLYVPGGSDVPASRSLVWVDRQGREESIEAPPRAYAVPRLSPDGTRIALQIRNRHDAVWIWDLRRQTLTPLSTDAGSGMLPVWTPDGRRIIFSSERGGSPNLYWQAADGSGTVERLTTTARPQFPYSVSPDGARTVIAQLSPDTQSDIGVLLQDRRTEMLIKTGFQEFSAEISPDGRWLAYQSNESGRYEIYARPFPNVDGGRWPISNGGGTRPAWARNGRELFYLDDDNRLTGVTVRVNESTLVVGRPMRLLQEKYSTGTATYGRSYDVSPDGRFLMIKDQDRVAERPSPTLVIVENWFEELKRLLPAR